MNEYLKKMERYEEMKRQEAEQQRKTKEATENDQITFRGGLSHEQKLDLQLKLRQVHSSSTDAPLHPSPADAPLHSSFEYSPAAIIARKQQHKREGYHSEYDKDKFDQFNYFKKKEEALTWDKLNSESIKAFLEKNVKRRVVVRYLIYGVAVYQLGAHLPYSYVYLSQARDHWRYRHLHRN